MLEYKGYHATIKYDADDHILIGEVFGITDSLNFHGTSIQELEEMFHNSIDNYLELCKKIGKTPEKEFKGSFNVRISPETHKKIALAAAQREISLNQYVSDVINDSLNPQKNVKELVIKYPEKLVSAYFKTPKQKVKGRYKNKISWKNEKEICCHAK